MQMRFAFVFAPLDATTRGPHSPRTVGDFVKSIHLCVNTEDTLDTLNLMWTLWTVSKPPFSLSRESDFQFSFFHKRI